MNADTKVGLVPLDRIDYHQHNVRVDLGDLRDLTQSIKRFGVMQPVVLEFRGQRLRIRAGHRRVAAARLAGLTKVPAVIHGNALEDDEWLVAAAHENTRRKDLDTADRARAVQAMRQSGMTWDAIGDALGISGTAAARYVREQSSAEPRALRPATGRAPTGRPSLRRSTIRTLAQEAQTRVDRGEWSAQDVVLAVLRLADDGTLSAALNQQAEQAVAS